LPPKDPDARCDGCGSVGTVGRALRFQDGVEIHHFRFCASCWVEESARLQARWEEENAQAQDTFLRTRGVAIQPSMACTFESATWHRARRYVKEHLHPSLRSATSPTAATLQELADRYRAMAPEMVGPMPYVVELFIAEYGSKRSSAPGDA
jgi:hypothetical protein